jgi:hypothetical protein
MVSLLILTREEENLMDLFKGLRVRSKSNRRNLMFRLSRLRMMQADSTLASVLI